MSKLALKLNFETIRLLTPQERFARVGAVVAFVTTVTNSGCAAPPPPEPDMSDACGPRSCAGGAGCIASPEEGLAMASQLDLCDMVEIIP